MPRLLVLSIVFVFLVFVFLGWCKWSCGCSLFRSLSFRISVDSVLLVLKPRSCHWRRAALAGGAIVPTMELSMYVGDVALASDGLPVLGCGGVVNENGDGDGRGEPLETEEEDCGSVSYTHLTLPTIYSV